MDTLCSLGLRNRLRSLFFFFLAYNINWQNTEYKLHYHKVKTFKQYSKKDMTKTSHQENKNYTSTQSIKKCKLSN